jgi:hypothetical protein
MIIVGDRPDVEIMRIFGTSVETRSVGDLVKDHPIQNSHLTSDNIGPETPAIEITVEGETIPETGTAGVLMARLTLLPTVEMTTAADDYPEMGIVLPERM